MCLAALVACLAELVPWKLVAACLLEQVAWAGRLDSTCGRRGGLGQATVFATTGSASTAFATTTLDRAMTVAIMGHGWLMMCVNRLLDVRTVLGRSLF